ncbi:helix-turn-helix domain-containing protein [Nocardia tengchongensis]|uniref:helix-turn-helix domain-containing protein n=1 Tax=Nocardia tengchongensis TaxID=2055889 RepID=UPI0036C6C88A
MSTSPSSSAQAARRALGERLREIRKAAGLCARQLAEATGRHYTRVSKIENAVQTPMDCDIEDWCRVCGASGQTASLRAVDSAYLEFRRQSHAGLERVLGAHTQQCYEQTAVFVSTSTTSSPASAGFWIFDESLAALETPTASIQVTQPADIHMYARIFEALKKSAVYGREARMLILKALTELGD